MRHFDLSGLNMGHIQAFIAVAQTQSFTKAAEYLHLSQPLISKRVTALENFLGFQLFVRWRRTVRLTPAGRVLYNEWGNLLEQVMEPINRANSCQLGYTRHLSVGYCASDYPYEIGNLFCQEYPNTDISFIRVQYPEMQSKLLTGELDLAFYGVFGLRDFEHPPFRCRILKRFPVVACMLPSNPLAGKESVCVADLKGQDFIMLSPLVAPAWLSFMTELCIRNHFSPQVSLYVEDTASLPMNLRSDHSVFFTDRYCTAMDMSRIELVAVDLLDAEGGTMVVWNEENENDLILSFIEKSVEYWNNVE